MTACPVCGAKAEVEHKEHADNVTCPRCGRFRISGSANAVLSSRRSESQDPASVLGHHLRKMQEAQSWPLLRSDVCQQLLKSRQLPTPAEQADRMLRYVGEHSVGPGEDVSLTVMEHQFIVGAKTAAGFSFIARGLVDQGLATDGGSSNDADRLVLTFEGWRRFEDLKRGAPIGRSAFMAMQYGEGDLDQLVNDHFRPAVEATGFLLQRLDDEPRAGLIDDRLRVEIRGARFLIADLTHRNNGAYWESGYAEGLGKPVIYTCREDVFSEHSTHFDTNHHLTVVWSPDRHEDASERLKATIRATLPEAS